MSSFSADALGGFVITKDPDDLLDYVIDWSSWLGTDTITSVDWDVDTGIMNPTSSHTATTATIWLAGGSVTETYNITCRITTAAGRVVDRSFRVSCVQQ